VPHGFARGDLATTHRHRGLDPGDPAIDHRACRSATERRATDPGDRASRGGARNSLHRVARDRRRGTAAGRDVQRQPFAPVQRESVRAGTKERPPATDHQRHLVRRPSDPLRDRARARRHHAKAELLDHGRCERAPRAQPRTVHGCANGGEAFEGNLCHGAGGRARAGAEVEQWRRFGFGAHGPSVSRARTPRIDRF
jgi:hypothetical protein